MITLQNSIVVSVGLCMQGLSALAEVAGVRVCVCVCWRVGLFGVVGPEMDVR